MLKFIKGDSVTKIYYWSINKRPEIDMAADMKAYVPASKLHYADKLSGWYWNRRKDQPRAGYIHFTDASGKYGLVKESDLLTIVWKCDDHYSGWGRRGEDGHGTEDAREPDAFTLDNNGKVVYLLLN